MNRVTSAMLLAAVSLGGCSAEGDGEVAVPGAPTADVGSPAGSLAPDAPGPEEPEEPAAAALVAGGFDPLGLAIAGDDLYFADPSVSGLRVVPMAGGNPAPIGGGGNGFALAYDDGALYWTDISRAAVLRTDTATGQTRKLTGEAIAPYGVAIDPDGNSIYVTDLEAGVVYRVRKDGSATEPLASGLFQPGPIVFAKQAVYVGALGSGRIWQIETATGDLRKLASDQVLAGTLASDGEHVYFTHATNGALMRVAVADGALETLVPGLSEPGDVALAGGAVYFTDAAEGVVYRFDPIGGGLERIATGQDQPTQLAVAGDRVLWVNRGEPAIRLIER